MIATLGKWVGDVALSFFPVVVLVIAGSIVERRHPIESDQPRPAVFLDYKLAFLSLFMSRVFAPFSGVVAATMVGAAGGGLIPLRGDGWWLPVSFLIVVLTLELLGYWTHRAQHFIPFLWSMHTLHHSAEAMTVSTGARHYWVEQAIIVAFLPSVAMVFKIPPQVMHIVPYFFITEVLAHLNAKVSFGPLTLVFNNPQFHRIHHSVELQHFNKNFCKNLPISDLIFGTAWLPGEDEFPRTGLATGDGPAGVLEGFIWPVRHLGIARMLLGSKAEASRIIGADLSSETG